MTGAVLRERWLHALRVARVAVDAAARVEGLPAEEVSRLRRLLTSERAWLNTVDWAAIGISSCPNVHSEPPRTRDSSESSLIRGTPSTQRLEVDNAQAHLHRNRSSRSRAARGSRQLPTRRRDARPRLPLVPGRRQVHEVGRPARACNAGQP